MNRKSIALLTFPIPLNFFVDEQRRVAYFNMPKVAGTSLSHTLLESEKMRQDFYHMRTSNADVKAFQRLNWLLRDERASKLFPVNIKIIRQMQHAEYKPATPAIAAPEKLLLVGVSKEKIYKKERIDLNHINDYLNGYFIFTFVRNPFDRLVSFFQEKYTYENGRYIHYRPEIIFFWFKEISSFEDFIYKISKTPDLHLEEHFAPQYIKTDRLKAFGIDINFIGRFEALEQDFEKVKTKFNLLPLEHINKSKGKHSDWRDYYTPQTAKMIYKRYHKDFEMFGYQDEYPKLLAYLKTKSKEAKK